MATKRKKKKKKKVDSVVQSFMDQITNAQVQTEQAKAEARSNYDKGMGDTKYVHDQVAAYQQFMNNQIKSGYDANAGKINAANAALQQQLQGSTAANATGANSELNRLGLSGVGPGNLLEDAAFSQRQAAQQGTNEIANNSFAQANSSAVGNLLQGMNQGQYQSTTGRLLNTRNDALVDLQNAFQDQRRQTLQDLNIYRMQKAEARRGGGGGGGGGGYGGGGYSRSGGGGSGATSGDAAIDLALGINGPKPKPKPEPNSFGDFFDDLATIPGVVVGNNGKPRVKGKTPKLQGPLGPLLLAGGSKGKYSRRRSSNYNVLGTGGSRPRGRVTPKRGGISQSGGINPLLLGLGAMPTPKKPKKKYDPTPRKKRGSKSSRPNPAGYSFFGGLR